MQRLLQGESCLEVPEVVEALQHVDQPLPLVKN
jgi:hypothetical protein